MSEQDVIERICSIPRAYRRGDVGVATLVKQSGYCDCDGTISRADIAMWLRRHPDFIDDWISWSEDQRISEGWAFGISKRLFITRYMVAYYPKGERLVFTDKAKACAEFIAKQEYRRLCAD